MEKSKERGIKLSAGQKQRLNLIRGILIDKDLLINDINDTIVEEIFQLVEIEE